MFGVSRWGHFFLSYRHKPALTWKSAISMRRAGEKALRFVQHDAPIVATENIEGIVQHLVHRKQTVGSYG